MKRCLSCNENFVSTKWRCPYCHWKPVFNGRFPLFAPEHAEDSSGFEDNLFPYLFALESSNFWFVARNQMILYFINMYYSSFRNFLEIGCGTGFVLSSIAANFPKAAIAGSELSVHGLSYAFNRVHRGSFIQMDATNIPFHEEFDLIGSFDVLEHIADDVSALAGIYRALAPGGVLIVTVPQHAWLWSGSDDMAHHVRRYSRQEISTKLKQAGYEILRSSSFVSFLLPFMMISRLKKGRDREEIMSDLNLNPIINLLFHSVMTSERKLIEHGVNFPFGGSLIIVARKNL